MSRGNNSSTLSSMRASRSRSVGEASESAGNSSGWPRTMRKSSGIESAVNCKRSYTQFMYVCVLLITSHAAGIGCNISSTITGGVLPDIGSNPGNMYSQTPSE